MEELHPAVWDACPGATSAGQAFLQRWLELFHRLSIDTYRVRHLNLRLAVAELTSVIAEVTTVGTDPVNVKDVAREVVRLLKEDPVADQLLPHRQHYYPSLLNPLLPDNKTVHPGLPILLDQVNATLQRNYRTALSQTLRAAVDGDQLEQLLALTSALASDLIGEGYDLRHLYWRGGFFTRTPPRPFRDKLHDFLLAYSTLGGAQFVAILRLEFSSQPSADDTPAAIGSVSIARDIPDLPNDPAVRQFVIPSPSFRYARCEVSAPDPFSAERRASAEVSRALDLLQFTRPSLAVRIPPQSLVLDSSGRPITIPITLELLGPMRIVEDELEARARQLTRIRADNRISRGTIDRLSLGMRYFRRGLTDATPQGQFLNLWIGLEAILGGTGRGVVAEMRRHGPRLIAVGYPRRLVSDLRENIRRLHLPLQEPVRQRIVANANTTAALVALCEALYDPIERDALLATAVGSPLLQQRIGSVAVTIADRSRMVQGIERNEEDVAWHIQRMFRIRNAIVHGGDVPEDLTHVASHLATYLWALLRVLLEELSRVAGLSDIADVYEKFAWLYDNVRRLLREDPGAKPPFATLVYPQSLWPR